MSMESDAEAAVAALRLQGSIAGWLWAQEQPAQLDRIAICEVADKRWPDHPIHFLRNYSLSGGFIDGAERFWAGGSNPSEGDHE